MGGPYRWCSPPSSPWQGGFYMSHFKQGRQDDLKMLNFKWEFKIDIKLTSPQVSKMQEEKKHFSLGWNRKVKIFIQSLPHPPPSSPRWNWQNSSALWQVNDNSARLWPTLAPRTLCVWVSHSLGCFQHLTACFQICFPSGRYCQLPLYFAGMDRTPEEQRLSDQLLKGLPPFIQKVRGPQQHDLPASPRAGSLLRC